MSTTYNNSSDYSPTQYNVVTGGATNQINNVAPSATSGVPLISQGSSSQPIFGTAVVAGGGTGVVTMTTAYAPVCAGTTATGALQVASTGLSTSGYVLTSNGSSALPSFQAASSGGSTIVTTYIASNTWTINAATKYVEVFAWGGGGGGGSGRQGVTTAAGGGGGGQGSGLFYLYGPATQFPSPSTITIAAGGTGGTGQGSAATDGNPGGASTASLFGVISTTYIAGTASVGGTTTTAAGGSGNQGFLIGSATGVPLISGGSGSNTSPATPGSIQPLSFQEGAGGGGSGADSGTARTGGSGQSFDYQPTPTVYLSGGAGGIESGTINGGNGASQTSTLVGFVSGGTGGGGGGGQSIGLVAGNGGTGGFPGGGGGGGGGSLAGTTSGAGGNGGAGQIIVIEYL